MELPQHYLAWLLDQPWLREPLATVLRGEAARRHYVPRPKRGPARLLPFDIERRKEEEGAA